VAPALRSLSQGQLDLLEGGAAFVGQFGCWRSAELARTLPHFESQSSFRE
jgi:hypothetical protein